MFDRNKNRLSTNSFVSFSSLLCFLVCWGPSYSQSVTYPYNPDGDDNGAIATPDVLNLLSFFGAEFVPSEIEFDGVILSTVLDDLATNQDLLEQIIEGQQQQIEDLENYISQLQQYISVTNNTVLIEGANLQVSSGSGSTDGVVNGRGNIIVGYDENDGNDKSGSHNIILGKASTYSSFGGLVSGFKNELSGSYCSVFGQENSATGEYASILGGKNNNASGWWSVVLGGSDNLSYASLTSVVGGQSNFAAQNWSSILGGYSNTSSTEGSTIIGGSNNN